MAETSEVKLIAVGDISFGDHPVCVGYGVNSYFLKTKHLKPLYPFEHVIDRFEYADIRFGNLETVLSDAELHPGKLESMEMRGNPDAIERFTKVGFNVLNIANNHILQHGVQAFNETIQLLNKHHITVVGLADQAKSACVPQVLKVKGIRIAFLGYAFEPDKYYKGRPLYAFGPDCDILNDIACVKESADIIVCSMHWGDEFIRYPSWENILIARQMIDAGAHLILGHHPHVYQGVEYYQHGVIAYSLGNFIFDMLWNERLRGGMVLIFKINRERILEVEPRFVYIGDDYQPILLEADRHEKILTDWQQLTAVLEDHPSEESYRHECQQLIAKNRYESYRYFMRHLWKSPLSLLTQIVYRTLKRKLADTMNRA